MVLLQSRIQKIVLVMLHKLFGIKIFVTDYQTGVDLDVQMLKLKH